MTVHAFYKDNQYCIYARLPSIIANVRVYDHLRCQSDSVSRYTKVRQSDTVCSLMPSN